MGFLGWSIAFFLLAIVAAVLGFGGLAGGMAFIAEILFFVFLIALVFSLVSGLIRRSRHA